MIYPYHTSGLMCYAASLILALSIIAFASPADRIVAWVGDDIILKSELKAALDFLALQTGFELKQDSNLIQQVLDRLIEDRLLQEEAKQETILVTKSEIENELKESINQLISRFPSRDEFEKALAEEGLTERILRENYAEEIRKRLTAQKLLAKKGLTNIYIAPSEAKQFYQEKRDSIAYVPGTVSLAHILLPITPNPKAEEKALTRSLEIYDILLRGGDFDEVSKSFSEDERTKKRGGFLGELKKSELTKTVDSVLSLLKPGEFSPPVRTPAGYQIFQLISRTKNSYQVNHILVKVPITKDDTLSVKRLAKNLRDKLLKGADFDSFARHYSYDAETRDQGGFLGQFLTSGLAPPFSEAICNLNVNELSEPVLSEHGYHLIKVLAKQETRILSFEELQDKIRNYLYQERLSVRLKDYLDQIGKRTFIAKKF